MEAFSAHIDLMGASTHLRCDFVDKASRCIIFSASVSAPECLEEARSVDEYEAGEENLTLQYRNWSPFHQKSHGACLSYCHCCFYPEGDNMRCLLWPAAQKMFTDGETFQNITLCSPPPHYLWLAHGITMFKQGLILFLSLLHLLFLFDHPWKSLLNL